MADPKPTSERLEALKARWESDRGSRVFLQLADEYRRLDREEDAVRILDEGLEANPGHVGARVARGRSLLALGRAREATSDLEKVIESDPTQMVAYRFLVEGYIQQGAADKARQRLSVYGLLNDADPDIAELDRKIRDLERAERTGAWPMPDASGASESLPKTPSAAQATTPAEPSLPEPPPPPPATAPAADEGSAEAPFPEAPPAEPAAPASPFAELSDAAEEEPLPVAPVAAPERAPRAIDPFPALTIPEDRRRYLDGFEEGLFGAPAAAAAPEEAEDDEIGLAETAEGPAESEPPDEPFDLAASPAGASEGDPFDLTTTPVDAVPDLGALLAPEAEVAEAAAEPVEPPPFEDPVEPDESFEALEEPAAVASIEPTDALEPAEPIEAAETAEPIQAGGPVESIEPAEVEEMAEPEAPAAPAEPPAAEPPAEPPADQGRATVTLGRLYLRQGHLREAEESFREVLAREADNQEAQRGLEEVAALRAPGVEVTDLLDGYRPGEHGEGLTARKRYALRRYLERLRGGGADVH